MDAPVLEDLGAPAAGPPPTRRWSARFRIAAVLLVLAGSASGVLSAIALRTYRVPTGSMAPTILGEHVDAHCTTCGFEFPAGVVASMPGDHVLEVTCPLCRRPQDVATAGRRAGTGVVVNRLSYVASPPARWDVVVFEPPSDPTKLFVQRVVGLPGETVELVEGDVFVNGQVARKPDELQERVWRPVYDVALVAPDARPWTGEGWELRPGQAPYWGGSSASSWLTFAQEIDDAESYVSSSRGRSEAVRDVRLSLRTGPSASSAGELVLAVRHDARRVAVRVPLVGGDVKLEVDGVIRHVVSNTRPVLSSELAFEYVDRRARLLENRRAILTWDDDAAPAPVDRTTVELQATGPVTLDALRVERDVHYLAADWAPTSLRSPVALGVDELLLLGDLPSSAMDGRYLGPIRVDKVRGRVVVTYR